MSIWSYLFNPVGLVKAAREGTSWSRYGRRRIKEQRHALAWLDNPYEWTPVRGASDMVKKRERKAFIEEHGVKKLQEVVDEWRMTRAGAVDRVLADSRAVRLAKSVAAAMKEAQG